jgi:hypothetical protein
MWDKEPQTKSKGYRVSIWSHRDISKQVKRRIGRSIVESVVCYGSEVWTINAEMKNRLNILKMDYLLWSERI